MMSKKIFEVKENESISECLDRMSKEGYTPVKRLEKPIFQEIEKNGEKIIEPVGQQIIFEGRKME